MDIYTRETSNYDNDFNVYLGLKKFNVKNTTRTYEMFFKYIGNQAANYVIRKVPIEDTILFIIKDICDFNKVPCEVNKISKESYTIATEPGVILNDILYLSDNIIKGFMANKTTHIVKFTESSFCNTLESDRILGPHETSIITKLIVLADHIATHYIYKKITGKENDYLNHSDYKRVGYTFSNILDINMLTTTSSATTSSNTLLF